MSKVLIIEDEKAMSDLVTIKFNVEGISTVQVGSLTEARSKLSTDGPFDAILTDYLLPNGDTTDFLSEIKSSPATAKIPVVVMTNYVEDVNLNKLKSLGVTEVLAKYQVVPAQIVDKVKSLLVSQPAP